MMATGFAYYHYALEEQNFFECMMATSGFDIPAGLAAAAASPAGISKPLVAIMHSKKFCSSKA